MSQRTLLVTLSLATSAFVLVGAPATAQEGLSCINLIEVPENHPYYKAWNRAACLASYDGVDPLGGLGCRFGSDYTDLNCDEFGIACVAAVCPPLLPASIGVCYDGLGGGDCVTVILPGLGPCPPAVPCSLPPAPHEWFVCLTVDHTPVVCEPAGGPPTDSPVACAQQYPESRLCEGRVKEYAEAKTGQGLGMACVQPYPYSELCDGDVLGYVGALLDG